MKLPERHLSSQPVRRLEGHCWKFMCLRKLSMNWATSSTIDPLGSAFPWKASRACYRPVECFTFQRLRLLTFGGVSLKQRNGKMKQHLADGKRLLLSIGQRDFFSCEDV